MPEVLSGLENLRSGSGPGGLAVGRGFRDSYLITARVPLPKDPQCQYKFQVQVPNGLGMSRGAVFCAVGSMPLLAGPASSTRRAE